MEPKKRIKASLSSHDFAVHTVGVFTLTLGLIRLFPNLSPAAIGIAPWLGATWLASVFLRLGIFSYRQWTAIDRGHAAHQTRCLTHCASLELLAARLVC
jgi:hypothetical protein